MKVSKTAFDGLFIIEPDVLGDERGSFMESYNAQKLQEAGLNYTFVQDNQSNSRYGVIRGLHFQNPPYDQAKLIRSINGEILDVVVDIRQGSPTFGKHFSIILSAANKKQLMVPAGFAHGFSVLSASAEIFYKCNSFYNKQSESGILYNDPLLSIDWQLPKEKIVISQKDSKQPLFKDLTTSFRY